MRFYLFILMIFTALNSYSQRQANVWYFGDNAGINFNSGKPEVLTNSAMSTYEGSAVISDTLGNLLFYTNGSTVWNANHQIMENGTGLNGDSSSCESAIIIPVPESKMYYYIFTVDYEAKPKGLQYSVVNINGDNGLGVVTETKNIPLLSPVPEKVTAVWHANKKDIWLVSHGWGNNKFYAWLITKDGIQTEPVISEVGMDYVQLEPVFVINAIGFLRFSPTGTKIASALLRASSVEILDFDANTGILTNPVTLDFGLGSPYGVEFSPDGTKLYASVDRELYQVDLTGATNEDIKNSLTKIHTAGNFIGALQLATDGKIYAAVSTEQHLGIVNNPNLKTPDCNFVEDGLYLNGRKCRMGLPDFMQSYFLPPAFRTGNYCEKTLVNFNPTNTAGTDSVSWNFGDEKSGILNTDTAYNSSHYYENSGTYTVELTSRKSGTTYKYSQDVIIADSPAKGLISDTTICGNNEIEIYPPYKNYSYKWNNEIVDTVFYASKTGKYPVEITNIYTSCKISDTVNITEGTLAEIILEKDTGFCKNDFYTINIYKKGYSYKWQDNSTDSVIIANKAGKYFVNVVDSLGCKGSDTVNITEYPLPEFSLGEDTTLCTGGFYILKPDISEVLFLWNDSITDNKYIVDKQEVIRLQITDTNLCKFTDSLNVIYKTTPDFSLGKDTSVCDGEYFELSVNTDIGDFIWNDKSNLPYFIPDSSGTYYVNVTNKCGTSSDTISVTFIFCDKIKIPNVFTPNSDGKNDFFYIEGIKNTTWSLKIYSRWGSLIFETDNYKNDWKAENSETGVYYYLLYNRKINKTYTGFVHIYK